MSIQWSSDDDFENDVNPRHAPQCVSTASAVEASTVDASSADDERHAKRRERAPRRDIAKPGSKPRKSNFTVDYGFDERPALSVGSSEVVELALGKLPSRFLRPTPWKQERVRGWQAGWQTRDHRCAFWHESECRWKVLERRRLHEVADPLASFPSARDSLEFKPTVWQHELRLPGFGENNGRVHADHTISLGNSTLPKHVKLQVGSPSKLRQKPQRTVDGLQRDYQLDDKAVSAVRSLHSRMRKESQLQLVPQALRGKVGGVHHLLQAATREQLVASGNFGIHTTYVAGKTPADAKKLFVAFTTQNLILNAVRQLFLGLPAYVCIDSTYRKVTQGHNIMLFGTTGPDQRFHAIGYGLCSSEDEEAHDFIWQALLKEINSVVAERIANKQFI